MDTCPECGHDTLEVLVGDLPSERFLHSGPVATCHWCEARLYELPEEEATA